MSEPHLATDGGVQWSDLVWSGRTVTVDELAPISPSFLEYAAGAGLFLFLAASAFAILAIGWRHWRSR